MSKHCYLVFKNFYKWSSKLFPFSSNLFSCLCQNVVKAAVTRLVLNSCLCCAYPYDCECCITGVRAFWISLLKWCIMLKHCNPIMWTREQLDLAALCSRPFFFILIITSANVFSVLFFLVLSSYPLLNWFQWGKLEN